MTSAVVRYRMCPCCKERPAVVVWWVIRMGVEVRKELVCEVCRRPPYKPTMLDLAA